jgi:uncharacterized membrane protein
MTVKTYRIWEIIVRFVVCAVVALSVVMGWWIPLVASIIAAMVIFITLRVNVKGVVVDERTNALEKKATYFAYSVGNFGMSLAGVILVFANHNALTSTPAVTGMVLFFTSFGFSIIKDLAYWVLNRRVGKTE